MLIWNNVAIEQNSIRIFGIEPVVFEFTSYIQIYFFPLYKNVSLQ